MKTMNVQWTSAPDERKVCVSGTVEDFAKRLTDLEVLERKRRESAPTHWGQTDENYERERRAIRAALPPEVLAQRYPDLAMPDGLSAKGKKAWQIIMGVLAKADMLETGGCKAFHNPKQWTGEYGRKSHLVIVYEGGDLGYFFDYDQASELSYSTLNTMEEAFKGTGLYTECCTSCYSAVYDA